MVQLFKHNQLAEDVFREKYALSNETPNQLFSRIAVEFATKELNRFSTISADELKGMKKFLSPQGRDYFHLLKSANKTSDFFYHYLSDFKRIVPGGSVLSTLGTDKLSSLSNCFVIASPEDSITGIFNTCNEQSQLMKYRGGVGFDISTLRPSKAGVKNSAKTSSGSVSFTDLFSQVTNTIGQNNRRGALMLSISINHPDVEEFILTKQDLTKVTGANMSVKVTDEFMQAVENNEDYILRFPINIEIPLTIDTRELNYGELYTHTYKDNTKLYYKKIKALDLWNKLIHCAWNTAEPGIIFEDAHNNYSPDSCYPEYKFVSTNPCFHPDTLISTEYGLKKIKDITIPMRVYSMDSTGKLVMAQGHASFISKKNVRTLKITLRNGNSIQITPEHKLYVHNKGWVEARNIVLGDKIAHLCRSRRGAKYAGVHLTTSPNKQKDQVMEHKFVYGDYEFGYNVHHKDRNTYNNSINNLELLSHSNHSKITSLEDNPQTHQVKNNLGQFISGFNSKRGKKTIIDLPKELSTNLKNNSYNNVVKIEDGDLTDVYDMHVDNTHCLIANNMVAHNCGEIAMQPYDSCRLIHHVLTSFVKGNLYTKNAVIDWDEAYKQFYFGMMLGDILIDLEIDAVYKIIAKINADISISLENRSTELKLWYKIIESAKNTRRTGIGFTALADMIAMLGLSYESDEAFKIVDKLMYIKQKAELNATIDLAIVYGSFRGYNSDKEDNKFFRHIKTEFPEEYERMLQHGRRNLSWSTVNVAA